MVKTSLLFSGHISYRHIINLLHNRVSFWRDLSMGCGIKYYRNTLYRGCDYASCYCLSHLA